MAWIIFLSGAARSRNGLFDFAWRKFFNRKTGETGRADCSASGVSKKQCALRVDIHEHTLAGGNCRQMCLDDRFDFAAICANLAAVSPLGMSKTPDATQMDLAPSCQ